MAIGARTGSGQDERWQLHLEDRLELLRYAPRDRALEILHLLLEAVYGEGYIRGAEGIKERQGPRRIPITRSDEPEDDDEDRGTGPRD
jgi:hypothetical protein